MAEGNLDTSAPVVLRHDPVIDGHTAGQLGEGESPGSSIVIVSYNSAATIGSCLHSVLLSLDDCDEVIVVDNASSDGTISEIERFLPLTNRLRLIVNPSNLGFSAGCNVGLRASHGAFLVLLNPDTIVWPRWLEKLRRALDARVGAVGPVSDNAGGRQGLGNYLEPKVRLCDIQDRLTERFSGVRLETKVLFGYCLMFRRDLLNRIGLLDEDLFLGNDDLELSWRIRSHRLRLLVVLDVFVHHVNHVSFASLHPSESHRLISESSAALARKLKKHMGSVPSDAELWGFG